MAFMYAEETWDSLNNRHGRWVDWLNDPRRNEWELVGFIESTHPGSFAYDAYSIRVATFKKERQI